MSRIKLVLTMILSTILYKLAWPSRINWRGIGAFFGRVGSAIVSAITWPFRMTWRGIKAIGRFFKRLGISIYRSPLRAYRRVVFWRNWLLEKVEYLQGESAKWRTAFTIVKLPYSALRMAGLSPQMAASFLIAGSAVGGGVVVNETILAEKSFSAGDAGIYSAPLDAPIFAAEEFNTLRVDLGTTAVGSIVIEDTTLGTAFPGSTLPSNETSVIIIGGLPTSTSPSFSQTFLETSYLLIDRWRCESLTISNTKVNKLIVTGMASDGQSFSPVPGTPRMRAVGGGNRAADMETRDSYFDQLKIQASSSGVNGKVDELKLINIYSRGGPCVVDRVLANVIEIRLSEIGGDSNLATKAFQIADTVVYKSFESEGNVEVAMAIPAVQ